jgi:cyanate permease
MNHSLIDRTNYRWVILALLWMLYVAFGLIQRSLPPLVTPVLADLQLSFTQMGFILGAWQLTYIVVAIFAGAMIDRWGIRKSLLFGAIALGLSAALRYYAQGFGSLLFAVSIAGVGGPMISIGCPKAISMWFQGRSRGTAVGIYLTGPWIGGIVALTLTNSLIMPLLGQSWRLTFLIYGLLTFGAGLLWWILARDREPLPTSKAPGMIEMFLHFIKVRNVRIALCLGLLSFAIIHTMTSWLPKILENGGFSPALAGSATAIPLAAGIPAILILPRLIPPAWRGRFLALCSLMTLLALLLIMTSSGALLLASLIGFGILFSPFYAILTLILMDSPEVGSAHMGSVGGMFFCISEMGGFAGPFIMGTIVDVTGTFQTGMFFFAFLCLASFLLSLLLKTRPPASA